jgi:hypothetical protein
MVEFRRQALRLLLGERVRHLPTASRAWEVPSPAGYRTNVASSHIQNQPPDDEGVAS